MSRQRSSAVALIVGAILVLLASVAGFLNANVVNGPRFAEHVNQMRQDPQLARAIGAEMTSALVDAQPDLVAIAPALQSAAAAVVASSAFNGVFVSSVASFHGALTREGSDSAVLTIADIGSSAVSLVQALAPDLAKNIPSDLDVRLAQVGGQQGPASQIIPLFQMISALAWVLPVLAIALWVLAVWVASDRRLAVLRIGWALVGVAAGLALLGVTGWVASRVYGSGDLTSALLESAADVFGRALAVRVMATAIVGGLLVVAASALLPQVHVHSLITNRARQFARRPQTPGWALLRAVALIAVGVALVLVPGIALALMAVLLGIAVFLTGVSELDLVVERARDRTASKPRAGARRWIWALPVVAVAGALGLLVVVLLPTALPQSSPVSAVVGDPRACNGHVELCDRPFDQVAFPASHNSMAAADAPGWYLAEQPTGMVASLDDGIRVFLIDTWYGQATESGGAVTAQRSLARAQADFTAGRATALTPAMQRTIDRLRAEQTLGPEQPYLCHTLCELGATEMESELVGVESWLDEHPREVVTIFIQDAVTPEDTAKILEMTGLADMAYVHQAGTPWPTLGTMVESGKRVLVLMENEGGGAQYPYLHAGFDFVQDTGFTYESVDQFDCEPNRGPGDADLLMVNHWLSSFTTLVSSAQAANTEEVLGQRVRQCREQRGQIPNFVAVNWYDQGDLLTVVDQLNGF